MPWTPENDRRLLLSVITALSPSPPNWDQVAGLMGTGYTSESCRQHYAKMKKNAGAELAAGKSAEQSASGAPQTPKSGSKRKSPVKMKAQKEAALYEDDEESPVKKSKIKAESELDDFI